MLWVFLSSTAVLQSKKNCYLGFAVVLKKRFVNASVVYSGCVNEYVISGKRDFFIHKLFTDAQTESVSISTKASFRGKELEAF